VNKIDLLEGLSRGFFIVVALFAFIGLAWSGEYRSVVGNTFYIMHIIILLFLAIRSGKLIKKTVYLIINIIGFCLAIYFIITESIYLFILGIIGFSMLILISFFGSHASHENP